jgi:hypothetical protein
MQVSIIEIAIPRSELGVELHAASAFTTRYLTVLGAHSQITAEVTSLAGKGLSSNAANTRVSISVSVILLKSLPYSSQMTFIVRSFQSPSGETLNGISPGAIPDPVPPRNGSSGKKVTRTRRGDSVSGSSCFGYCERSFPVRLFPFGIFKPLA